MRVEFVGPPGVGKSTMARSILLAASNESDLNFMPGVESALGAVRAKRETLRKRALLLLLHRKIARRYLALFLHHEFRNERDKGYLVKCISSYNGISEDPYLAMRRLRHVQYNLALIEAERRFTAANPALGNATIFLYDELMLQRSCVLSLGANNFNEVLVHLFGHAPKSDLYVVMDADDETIQNRTQKRDQIRCSDETQRLIDAMRCIPDLLESFRLPFIQVRSGDSPRGVITQIGKHKGTRGA